MSRGHRTSTLLLATLVTTVLAVEPSEAAPRPGKLWPSTRAAKPASTRPTSRPSRIKRNGDRAVRTYRRAIGALGTALCYHAYRSIKSAADGLLRRGVRRRDVRTQMAATRRTLRASREQLGAVSRLPLAAVDRLALRQMVGALDRLIGAAKALEGYAKSKAKRDFNRFELRRRAAWRELRRLLAP
jgi:hypothetical protein